MSIKYGQLDGGAVRYALSVTPLKMAAAELEASHIYTLHVGEKAYYNGKHVAALAMEKENPFSPYINLVIDTALEPEEWYLSDEHGNACGSKGI